MRKPFLSSVILCLSAVVLFSLPVHAKPKDITDSITYLDSIKKDNVILANDSLDKILNNIKETSSGNIREQLNTYLEEKDLSNTECSQIFWHSDKIAVSEEDAKTLENNAITEKTSDFTPEVIQKDINEFVKTQSNGQVPLLIPDRYMNKKESIYLSLGTWKQPWKNGFDMTRNTIEPFGKTGVENIMMHSRESIYLENEKATGFMKEYEDGSYFVGILPKEEKEELLVGDLDVESLLASKKEESVNVSLPKMNLSWSGGLVDVLTKSGLDKTFNTEETSLGKVYSVAVVNSIHFEEGAYHQQENDIALRSVSLNRPFAFLIIKDDNVLFSGKVTSMSK